MIKIIFNLCTLYLIIYTLFEIIKNIVLNRFSRNENYLFATTSININYKKNSPIVGGMKNERLAPSGSFSNGLSNHQPFNEFCVPVSMTYNCSRQFNVENQ